MRMLLGLGGLMLVACSAASSRVGETTGGEGGAATGTTTSSGSTGNGAGATSGTTNSGSTGTSTGSSTSTGNSTSTGSGASSSSGTTTSGASTSTGSTGSSAATTSSGGGGSGGASASSTSTGQGTGGSVGFDAGVVAEVFGQTPTTLYKLDPTTNAITVVGDFTGQCAAETVIDIALDKAANMYATTFAGFYTVDKTTAACTHIASGTYPNSLSFVPAGTLDPNVEALVGYNGADYLRIDPTSGAVTTVASGALGSYASSGDIVSVIGGGTYLTVTGNGCADCIVQVDPATGALKSMIGPLGHSEVYGLAYWGGDAYGFDASGNVFQIDLTNASTMNIPVPNAPPGLTWYGAGSATSVPLTR